MIVLDIYDQLKEEIIISETLGVVVSNLCDDGKTSLMKNIVQDIKRSKRVASRYSHPYSNVYDIKSVISKEYFNGVFPLTADTEDGYLESILDCLICVQVIDFEESPLFLKNEFINPTCETSFEKKLIDFYNLLSRSGNLSILNVVYSFDDNRSSPEIIPHLLRRGVNINTPFSNYISERKKQIGDLTYFGRLLDGFLEYTDDFFLLDFLLNAVQSDNQYNAYYVFKMVSIIEMLVKNPKKTSLTEVDINEKIPQFISDRWVSNKEHKILLSNMLKKIRNKIAHGDYWGLHKHLELYAQKFMEEDMLDYGEYSKENWIYGNLCMTLNDIVANIFWRYLTHKKEMEQLKLI